MHALVPFAFAVCVNQLRQNLLAPPAPYEVTPSLYGRGLGREGDLHVSLHICAIVRHNCNAVYIMALCYLQIAYRFWGKAP
jgi:hypothetical protein